MNSTKGVRNMYQTVSCSHLFQSHSPNWTYSLLHMCLCYFCCGCGCSCGCCCYSTSAWHLKTSNYFVHYDRCHENKCAPTNKSYIHTKCIRCRCSPVVMDWVKFLVYMIITIKSQPYRNSYNLFSYFLVCRIQLPNSQINLMWFLLFLCLHCAMFITFRFYHRQVNLMRNKKSITSCNYVTKRCLGNCAHTHTRTIEL